MLAASLPAAAAGLLLERPIERRLGGVRAVALAQVAAGGALWLADRSAGAREEPESADRLAVGVAQAAALVPGVSRAGAALTAARLRGLSRPAAWRLSLEAALPLTLGATALKAAHARTGVPGELRRPMAAGAGAALISALVAGAALGPAAHERSYTPVAAYRVALGTVALATDLIASRRIESRRSGQRPLLAHWRD